MMRGRRSVGGDRLDSSAAIAAWLTASTTNPRGHVQSDAPVPGYGRVPVDEVGGHTRMWKGIADFLATSTDEWGAA
jgi:hypothetical protein